MVRPPSLLPHPAHLRSEAVGPRSLSMGQGDQGGLPPLRGCQALSVRTLFSRLEGAEARCQVLLEQLEEAALIGARAVEDEVCEAGIHVLLDAVDDLVGI